MPDRKRVDSVSVLIPTIGRPQLLANCLRSISRGSHLPAEVVVVDQSVGESTVDVVGSVPGLHTRVVRAVPEGTSVALNVGLRSAIGAVVAITNDDCTVAEDWLE